MLNRTATTLLISCLATSSAEAEALAMTSVATIDVFAVEPLAGADKGPQWIKLAPRGPFTARDARKFTIDPELLVERFNADKVALPIDVDHATVKKAMFGESAPAIGWIEELQARPDGLYGRVEWLEPGLAILAAKSHRFISPALKTDDHGRAYWLHSAGLVAAPGISMPAVASADPTHTETNMLKAIAKALNLQEDANEAACLSAIGDMLTKRVDPAIHQQALDQVKTLGSELESIKAVDRKSKIDTLLEGALTAKKISPAQRESYEALCATDSGFEQVWKLIETLGAGLAPSDLDNKRGGGGDLKTLSAEDRTIIKEMGLSEEEYRKANGLDAA
ncbi:phage protease [Neorhizobium sp. T786]|uniref:phage protease n=1 Tax=Pseudorhizobium xiangyangii TaxID=2883104 RepID=UPI001CFF6D2D|nr:phage protease [Neorhizobium xiangyangii]MCB5204245.1 phage protease [Neorhizobium xiangyangii]